MPLLFYSNSNKKLQKYRFLRKNKNKIYAKHKIISGKF